MMALSRRAMFRLGFWGVVGSAAGTLGYTWRVEPHWIEVVQRELPIAGLPARLHGRTLVQISDLHIGPIVDDDYIADALERVASLRPDVLAVTGDFMSCRGVEEIDKTIGLLKRHLEPARLATLAVLGNHDYGSGWKQPHVAAQLTAGLQDVGVHVLRNEAVDVEGLSIGGMDDLWSGQFKPERLLPNLQRQQASLVLCHNPDAVDQPVWAGYQGWILSGHTHGGQCKPPWGAPPILPVNNHRYAAGAIDLGDGRHLYVNRALGYLKRVRFNVRPEITVFTLTSQPARDA